MALWGKDSITSMKGIVLWGTGTANIAEPNTPGLLKKHAPTWAPELDILSPWRALAIISEGPQSRCWLSEKKSGPPLILITGHCRSCMDLAWHLNQKNILPEWGSVLVSSQWKGRGQLGREWISPEGNVYAAMRLPPSAQQWEETLSLMMGYALIRSLAGAGVQAQLKWPNDLIIRNKKVGGILIEERDNVIMAGVGINILSCPSASRLRDGRSISAACLHELGHNLPPLWLWHHLATNIEVHFQKTIQAGTSAFIASLHEHLAFLNARVLVDTCRQEPYEATVLGLSPNGGLRLLAKNGTTTVRSASIYPLAIQ